MTIISRLKTIFINHFLELKIGRVAMKTGIRLLVPKHRIGVNIVCLDSENHILMLKHTFHPLVPWGLPGGWMDPGETPEQCALRELQEETGIANAIISETLAFFRNSDPDHLNIIVMAHIDAKQPQITVDEVEILEGEWITPATVPSQLTKHTIVGIQTAWSRKNIHFNFPADHMAVSEF